MCHASFILFLLVLGLIDYDERVLPSIVNEVTKAVVAKYNASELLTKREVGAEITDMFMLCMSGAKY